VRESLPGAFGIERSSDAAVDSRAGTADPLQTFLRAKSEWLTGMPRLIHPLLLKVLDRVTITLPRRLPLLKKRNDLDGVVKRLHALRSGDMPPRKLLADLRFSWGNAGFSPSLDLLIHLAEHATKTDGPILECGSGLSTLLLGIVAGKRGIPIWSLEHHEGWQQRMTEIVAQYRLQTVNVVHAPLRDYGEFEWYDISAFPADTPFTLAVVDGPPRLTKGGRVGFMPVMGDQLSPDCIIVLDDSFRRSEQRVIADWTAREPMSVREIGTSRSLAELSLSRAC
jgi:hypothetical protein